MLGMARVTHRAARRKERRMLYRLMLVDDEPEIREGMKEIVDWEACGVRLVAEADNGLDALQLAEQTRPDLVITDVRMHFMDGLEMVQRMRAFLPMTQFVVVSGYDEFEYTRKSIQIKIADYVLKPISAAEYIKVLARAKHALDEEHARHNSVQVMNRIFSDSLPILRQQLLYSLMSGGMDEVSVRAAAARYDLDLDADRYVVALFRIASGGDNALAGDEELVRLAVDRIVREVLSSRVACHVFNYNGQLAVLTMLRKEQSMSELLALMDTAATVVRDYLGASVTAGVGEPCQQLSSIPESATQAMAALNHWALVDDSQVIYIRDLKPRNDAHLAVDPMALSLLSSAIRTRLKAEIAQCVQALIDRLRGKKISFSEYQTYMLEALMAVIQTARDMQVELNVTRSAPGSLVQDFLEARDLDDAGELLLSLCLSVADAIGAGRRERGMRIAQQAQDYIAQRAGDSSLSIERVCEELKVSPAYFRALFKRETGQTFHQYLTVLRMNRAMEFLRTTSLKTAEVAQQNGLGEASYFSYAFKKHFGVSPSQVRKENE
jgi:two-component system, response regulator YesN